MLRYQERRRSPHGVRYIRIGASSGEDPDADSLTVLLLFHRHDRRRLLSRILIRRERAKDIKGERDRKYAYRTVAAFARALCCRGLIEFQGSGKEPQRSCWTFRNGRCPRFDEDPP